MSSFHDHGPGVCLLISFSLCNGFHLLALPSLQSYDNRFPLVDKGLTWPEIFEQYAKTSKGKADKDANADAMRLAYGREYPAK